MRVLLLIVLFFSGFAVRAQQSLLRDLWLNETSTPVKVNDMVQDATGYIWMGTEAGLYRFNGRGFTFIPDSVNSAVTALTYGDGHIYVGYRNGSVGLVSDNRVQPVHIQGARPQSAINAIYTDVSKVLWLSTESGIYMVLNNFATRIGKEHGLSDDFVYQMVVMPNRTMLVATDIGINELKLLNGKIAVTSLTGTKGLPDNIIKVMREIPGRRLYWIGMQQKGLAFYDPIKKRVLQPRFSQEWAWGQVNDIVPLDANRAWAVTEEGYLLDVTIEDSSRVSVRPVFVKDKKLKRVVCGRSGIVWCATNMGLTLVPDEYMAAVNLSSPYQLSQMRSMIFGPDNTLWFSQGKRLYRARLGNTDVVPQLVQTLPADITSLYADRAGRVWIGTFGAGIWYKDAGGRLVHVDEIPGLGQESILDIAGTDERLWVSGLNGVVELSYPGTYTNQILMLRRHRKEQGTGSDYVYQLYPDRKGRIWMATDGAGVRMFDEGRYRKWDSSSGFDSKVVYSITQDGFGNIWTVTLNNGLYKFNGEKWEHISREQGLQDINISTIAANATGQVVTVHAKGIDAWYPYSKLFRNYNKRQGFGIDSNSSVLNLSANDTANNVYIPYEKGLVVFKNLKQNYDIRPIVNISNISIFFKPVEMGYKYFDYDQNHISFGFEGVNFANPERLRYRYKLEGYNDSWIITNDEQVTFPQLSTGNYKFRVQASLNNSFSNFGEASYEFSVAKPFWFRTWFILLIVAGVMGVTYMYILMREKNLRKVSSLQRERMVFEYEHLKSQVNPHFLFNSLNTLANLIDENANAAIDYTVRLSDLYRNMLSYRDKDLILLSEEWEILENYLYIQQSRFGEALRLKVDIPGDLKYTRKIVPLALQLLVENAIKHNVVSTNKPLTIEISATEDTITIKNKIRPKLSKEKGAGLGLMNIKKRYSLLSKKQIFFGADDDQFIVKLPLL